MVYVLGLDRIKPLSVGLSETISEIKERVCDQMVEDLGKTCVDEPEQFQMVVGSGYVLDNDTTRTLEQALIHAGLMKAGDSQQGEAVRPYGEDFTSNSESPEENILKVKLYSASERLPWWTPEDEYDERNLFFDGLLEDKVTHFEEDYEEDIIDPEDAFSVKRPDDNILPTNTGSFRNFGDLLAYRLTDQGVKKRYISYVGPSYPLDLVINMTTTASLVLLAFNSANLGVLKKFSVKVRHISDTLCLQVNWDKYSYLFLRKLRLYLDPDVPIVAVTDLDVRHLELLAFLDTPPHDLPELYGWDLSQDCAVLGVQDIKYVNIKWLGIRPSDSMDTSPYHACFAKASCKLPDDFSDIYDSLLAHPHLAGKTEWVKELQFISGSKLHRSLPYLWKGLHCLYNSFVWKHYLAEKIKQRDWI